MNNYKIISAIKPLNLNEIAESTLESTLIRKVLFYVIPYLFQEQWNLEHINKLFEHHIQQLLNYYLNFQTKVTVENLENNIIYGHISFIEKRSNIPKIITFHINIE